MPDCDDGNPCTADSCDPVTGCRNTPVAAGTSCDDGRYCTTADACNSMGVCTGAPRDCGAPSDTCLLVECNEAADRCEEVRNPSGVPCSSSTKPQVMVILDNSGTMSASTGAGVNSCGRERTRLSDAKCVLSTVVSGYGDIVFGLERFRQVTSGTCSGACSGCGTGTCPATCTGCTATSLSCSACDPSAATPAAGGCPATGGDATQGEILAPIIEDTQPDILRWVDYSCDSCTSGGGNPELGASGTVFTPIAGALRGARRYFEGGDPSFASPINPARTCTPYYVVLITDGTEACSTYADAVRAATELRTTRVGAATFDIRTYTIGVGIAPGSFSAMRLGEVASAGGTMPFFATDEDSLSIAFARILEDSLLVETCNGADDDCDSRIDEGFTLYCDRPGGVTAATLCADPGDPCDGMDDNCARGTEDEVRNACGLCGPVPVEICDRRDNDCDGAVDEPPADCSCIASAELCDGMDNDCDTRVDESLSRGCGFDVGACSVGTETCTAGVWGGCTGSVGSPEECNGIDDDCDGVVDGLTRGCGPMAVGECRPGVEVCAAGAWGACIGAVSPRVELCDGDDNDCDGAVDEADPSVGMACESTCGGGALRCVMGGLACVSDMGAGRAEECNGSDDDCDGLTDEGIGPRGPCDGGGTLCIAGEERCLEGRFQCVGGAPPEPEVCDCVDNDCNEAVDDGASCDAAGAGARCIGAPHCLCARPCDPSEFPCAPGFRCAPPGEVGEGFCLPDECAGVECPPVEGATQVCVAGACVPLCDTVECDETSVCNPVTGRCVSDDCYGFPERCPGGTRCIAGECEGDLCADVDCAEGTFCRAGECVGSCVGVACASGERCEAGACVEDACEGVSCAAREVCDPASGTCVPDACASRACPRNTVCEPRSGRCVRDPCLDVMCPGGGRCVAGECVGEAVRADAGAPAGFDAAVPGQVLAAGGVDCACAVAPRSRPGAAGLLASLVVLGFLVSRAARRARREGGRA
jgi:hypothetical protein